MLAGCLDTSPAPEGLPLECAIGPGAAFDRACLLETVSVDEVVLHRPDGGFRRLIREKGNRLVPADGADAIRVLDSGDGDEGERIFLIGDEQYRVPDSALRVTANE